MWSNYMELEIENTEVVSANNIQVEVPNAIEVSEGKKDYEVSVVKKEYTIIGDSIFIPSMYGDAPPWLKEFIDTTIEVAVTNRDQSLIDKMEAILTAMDYVPKNQYTEQINQIVGEDSIINSRIATLNSNLTDAINSTNATIAEINLTYASKNEAAAIATNVIAASLSGSGEIGSTLIQLQEAYANLESTTAQNISMLESVMEGEINGNAAAMETIRTYVGIDESGASTGVGLLADVKILQKQNDGVIETVTGTYDVMLGIEDPNNNTDNDQLDVTKEPYASWLAEDLANGSIAKRSAHVGDVYIKYSNSDSGYRSYEKAYKFIRTVVDTTSPYATDSEGFTWSLIVDTDAQNAYVAALNAYDLADDKRRIFVGLGATSTPSVPYDQGDLWLIDVARVVNGYSCKVGDILRCIEAKGKIGSYEQNDWIIASSYANAVAAQAQSVQSWIDGAYSTTIADIHTQLDQKAESYYQDTMPHPEGTSTAYSVWVGDLWKKPSTNDEYIYQLVGSTYVWVKTDVPDIVYDTIDGKKSIFSGNTVPTAIGVNDMWITGDRPVSPYLPKSIYIWSGTAWVIPVRYTDDTQVIALQTGLANGTVIVDLTNSYVGGTPLATYLSNEIDGKVGIYSGETAPINGKPSGVAVNDIYLWFTTASKVLANGTTQVYDITRTYKYSGSVWNEITTDSNIVSLADLADGKRTVFSGATIPIGAVERDIWIPSASNASYTKGEVYQYIGSAWVVATKYTADIEAVRTNLQSQLDGKVETYYQSTVPTEMTAINNGDYWYCTADVSTYKKGKVYKYVHATTSWVETADVSRYAFDVADGKAAIFSSTNLPTSGYKINDMLIIVGSFSNGTTTFADGVVLSSTANRTSGFTPADWVKKINDTEDLDAFVNNTYTPAVTSLQNQVDGKVESWFKNSTSDPKTAWTDAATRSKHDGDLWYQLDTKRSYWYSSSTHAWNLIDDEKAIQALANAAAAQTAANNAQTSANTANSLLSDIANDNKLVPSEKVAVKKEWDIIQSEYTKNLAQGNVYGISTSSYTSAYNALSGYITPLLSSLTTTSDIVGTTFRGMFKAYYDANVDLLNAVANKINAVADGKITSYYVDTFASLQTLSNGWTTTEKDSNVGDLATIWNDSTLDNNGLWRWNGTSWVSARDKKLVALASTVTNLSTELNNGTSTWASADSALENSLKTEISGEGARVESKFAYNSVLKLNGTSYSSGFGIATSLTSGSGLPTGQSEFWIKADKFKLISADGNKKSSYSPFTVDSVTGEINFNGKVTFSNVTNVPVINKTYVQTNQPTSGMNKGDTWIDTDDNNNLYTYNGSSWVKTQSGAKTYLQTTAPTSGMIVGDIWVDSDDNYKQYRYNGSSWVVLDYNPATAINTGTTTINGGKITTGSITAAQIQANSVSADKLNVTTLSSISANLGTITSGVIYDSTWDGSSYKMKIDLTNGRIYIK